MSKMIGIITENTIIMGNYSQTVAPIIKRYEHRWVQFIPALHALEIHAGIIGNLRPPCFLPILYRQKEYLERIRSLFFYGLRLRWPQLTFIVGRIVRMGKYPLLKQEIQQVATYVPKVFTSQAGVSVFFVVCEIYASFMYFLPPSHQIINYALGEMEVFIRRRRFSRHVESISNFVKGSNNTLPYSRGPWCLSEALFIGV